MRARRGVLLIAVALLVGVLHAGCNTATTSFVKRHNGRVDRDPETGILVGAEPRAFGPKSAKGAVLFVHGFAGSPNNFKDLPEAVAAADWHVQVMLLPGHGTSPLDFEPITAQTLLDAVLAEIRTLQETHEQVVVVGHSMGATLAILAAVELDVDGLVLAAPHFAVTYKWFLGLRREHWMKLLGPVIRWGYFPQSRRPVKHRQARKEIVMYSWMGSKPSRMAIDLAARTRNAETLENVSAPVLLIHANDDRVTSPKASRKAFELIGSKQKRYQELHNSDHMLFWDHDAEFVNEEVLRFLDQSKL